MSHHRNVHHIKSISQRTKCPQRVSSDSTHQFSIQFPQIFFFFLIFKIYYYYYYYFLRKGKFVHTLVNSLCQGFTVVEEVHKGQQAVVYLGFGHFGQCRKSLIFSFLVMELYIYIYTHTQLLTKSQPVFYLNKILYKILLTSSKLC